MIDEHLNKTFRQIFRYDKDIGHQFISNLNARVINENGGYYVRTNSLGFRSDIEFKKEKNNNPFYLPRIGFYKEDAPSFVRMQTILT